MMAGYLAQLLPKGFLMKWLPLLVVPFSLLIVTPSVAQQQLVWPVNPQRGGFPPGHPGIPAFVDAGAQKPVRWDPSELVPGDRIVLHLIDDAAIKYFDFVSFRYPENETQAHNWIGISLESSVVAIADGKVTVEYYTMLGRHSDSPSIITITVSTAISNLSGPRPLMHAIGAHNPIPDAVNRRESRHAGYPSVRIQAPDDLVIRRWGPVATAMDREYLCNRLKASV